MAVHLGESSGGEVRKLSAKRAVLVVGIFAGLLRHILKLITEAQHLAAAGDPLLPQPVIPLRERLVVGKDSFDVHEATTRLEVLEDAGEERAPRIAAQMMD